MNFISTPLQNDDVREGEENIFKPPLLIRMFWRNQSSDMKRKVFWTILITDFVKFRKWCRQKEANLI